MFLGNDLIFYNDFQRDYDFAALFYDNSSTNPGSIFPNPFWKVIPLTYISQLVTLVKPPSTDISIKEIDFSIIKMSFPDKFVFPQFSVTFMEDKFNTVSKFFRLWFLELTNNNKLTIKPLEQIVLGFMFARTDKTYIPVTQGDKFPIELPSHTENYPRIIPIRIQAKDSNKEGDNFTDITVTFARIPEIVVPKPSTSVSKSSSFSPSRTKFTFTSL